MDADSNVSPVELAAWLPQLLQTTDSIFPTGSYAHSFSLEGITHLGLVRDAVTLRDFLKQFVIPSLEHLELPYLGYALAAAQANDVTRLCQLDQHYGAMKGARELRLASVRIGSQRLSMLVQIATHPLLQALESARLRGEFDGHSPVVFGAQAAVIGMPLDAALMAYYYQAVAALLSASMKLIRIGQVACQTLLAEVLAESSTVCARSRLIPESEAGWFSPLQDIASAQHETAYTRLFIS